MYFNSKSIKYPTDYQFIIHSMIYYPIINHDFIKGKLSSLKTPSHKTSNTKNLGP